MTNSKPSPKKDFSSDIAEKELQENPTFYKHLVEVTPEAVVVHQDGVIVYVNEAALTLIGAKSKRQIIGKSVMDFVHPESIPLIQTRIKMMLSKQKVAPFAEEKFINLQGETIVAQTKAVPFTFQGKPAILAILRDISKQKTIEDQLRKSEERFRTLIQESSDAIQLLNKEGIILYSSDSIKRVLGYSPKEIEGKNAAPYLHPDDSKRFYEAFTKLLSRPEAQVTLEYRVKHNNGSWVWVEATGVNHLTNPVIGAIVGNFRAITKRKKMEERQAFLEQASELLNSSLDYKTTLKNISKLLVPYLADYIRIVLVNDAGEVEEVAAHHSDPKKLSLVKNLYAMYKNSPEAYRGVNSILHSGKSEIMETVPLQSADPLENSDMIRETLSKLQLVSYMGVPLKLQQKVIGAITFSSSRKELVYTKEDVKFAEELASRIAFAIEHARLYSQSQKAIVLRDDFISLASHELKTPITSLKMYIQSLERRFAKSGDESGVSYFEKMDRQINKLTLLVNDLLDASKIQHGKLEFTMEKTDLNKVVTDTVEEVQETTSNHKILIKGEITKKAYADQYRIYQVLTNLLTNAIKYSPQADTVLVMLTEEKDVAVVSVQDFGIGIDINQQKKIFGQFYRVESPEEKTYPGLGMGLYISQEIIKRHGGHLSVSSQKGKGSQFSFTIPYAH